MLQKIQAVHGTGSGVHPRTPAAVPLPASCFTIASGSAGACALVTRASAVFWAPPPMTASASPDCAAASGLRTVTRLPLPAPCDHVQGDYRLRVLRDGSTATLPRWDTSRKELACMARGPSAAWTSIAPWSTLCSGTAGPGALETLGPAIGTAQRCTDAQDANVVTNDGDAASRGSLSALCNTVQCFSGAVAACPYLLLRPLL